MTTASELLPLSYRHPQFPLQLASSLQQFGFAVIVDHPLNLERVWRIYRQWQVFFNEGGPQEYASDSLGQDGYFAVDFAEHAKGYTQRDYKEYFQFYPWGRCPDTHRGDLLAYFDEAVALGATFLSHLAAQLPEPISARLSESLQSMIRGRIRRGFRG